VRVVDIQRWYNALHSRGCIYVVYTPPWESINKASYMGDTWQIASVTQDILDQKELMSAVLITLLSSTYIFKGGVRFFAI
jgi:hypothetical protein